MTTRFADHLLDGTHLNRPAATAVPTGTLYACSDHSLVYQSDGSAWATWADFSGGGGGGGASFTGQVITAAQHGSHLQDVGGAVGVAGRADLIPISIPGTMYVRTLGVRVETAGTGTGRWAIFDYSTDPLAATKLAEGTNAQWNATGIVHNAADSVVSIGPGNYALIIAWPATNAPNIGSIQAGTDSGARTQGSYVWDDTPDLTAFGSTSIIVQAILLGDLDAAGTQW